MMEEKDRVGSKEMLEDERCGKDLSGRIFEISTRRGGCL